MMLHEDRYAFLAILNQIHDADILSKDFVIQQWQKLQDILYRLEK